MRLAPESWRAAARFASRAWRHAFVALVLWAVAAATFIAAPSLRLISGPGLFLISLSVRGALWRLVYGCKKRGLGGLRFAALELRLGAAAALGATFIGILTALGFVLLLCCAYAAASAGRGFNPAEVATWAQSVDDRGRAFVETVALLVAAAIIWAALRISLAEASTARADRVRVLSSWAETRGKTLALLLTNGVIAIGSGAVLLAGQAIFVRPAPALERGLISLLQGLILAFVCLPLNVGAMAFLLAGRGPTGDDQRTGT